MAQTIHTHFIKLECKHVYLAIRGLTATYYETEKVNQVKELLDHSLRLYCW